MHIGKRLRSLRIAKGLSQGDIERRSGLLRAYISRVEGEHTSPTLQTLEKFADALRMESYQLLFPDPSRPPRRNTNSHPHLSQSTRKLVKLYHQMNPNDRKLLVTLAAKLAKS